MSADLLAGIMAEVYWDEKAGKYDSIHKLLYWEKGPQVWFFFSFNSNSTDDSAADCKHLAKLQYWFIYGVEAGGDQWEAEKPDKEREGKPN